MIIAIIETTALELKPDMAWAGEITPDKGRVTMRMSPTISTLTMSRIKKG